MRLEACSPRWDAASSTRCTLPVPGAARMQAEKLAVQRGRAEDDGSERWPLGRVSAKHEGSRWPWRTCAAQGVLAELGRGIEH